MIVFNINHTSYSELLRDLAAALHTPFTGDDYLLLTPPAGNGIIKVVSLFDELQVMMVDASFGHRLVTARNQSDQRYYILHFDDVMIKETARFTVDGEVLQKSNTRHTVARLTSNLFANTEEIPAHVHIKSVKILFNEQWLSKYLGLSSETAVLQQYLALKTESFDIEKLDAEYLQLMDSLWCVHKMEPLHNIFLQNRVALLAERFFIRLHEKRPLLQGEFKLTNKDIRKMMQVKALLVNDFSKTPPTLVEICRKVTMGSTQLKKKFREVYGDSIFAFYQKQRMHKARELLVGDRLSVTQVAEAIGYLNTSNFITAFKKQFALSPGEVSRA